MKKLCIDCSRGGHQFLHRINPKNPPVKCDNCGNERRQYTTK